MRLLCEALEAGRPDEALLLDGVSGERLARAPRREQVTGIMNYSIEHETAVGECLNALQLVGALRSHVDVGGQELLDAVGRRVWKAVLILEPKRRALLERAK